MRDGWSMSTVGALVENLDARRVPVKKSERRPGPYPYYGASGVVDYVDAYLFEGEFLLVAEDGENLNTRKTPIAFLASGRFWVNNHAHILRGMEDVDTRFLAYFLEATDINGYVTGSAQPKLSQGNLNAIPVVLPTLDEREGIVRVLRTLDDKIEANRALNETLEATCHALFRSWFVDFDPVVAKTEGRRPPHLTDEVAALFPDRFEDSPLGPVPAGWRVGTVGDIAELVREGVQPKDNPLETFLHFSIPAFDAGKVPAEELGTQIQSNKFLVPRGAVLLAKLNPHIPRVWWPDDERERRAVASTEFLVMAPRPPMERCYLYGLFSSSAFLVEFASLVTGTSNSHQRVKPDDFLRMPVVIPAQEVVRPASHLFRPMMETQLANLKEAQSLAALRDALLPRLLSGELRVRQAEKLVGEAV